MRTLLALTLVSLASLAISGCGLSVDESVQWPSADCNDGRVEGTYCSLIPPAGWKPIPVDLSAAELMYAGPVSKEFAATLVVIVATGKQARSAKQEFTVSRQQISLLPGFQETESGWGPVVEGNNLRYMIYAKNGQHGITLKALGCVMAQEGQKTAWLTCVSEASQFEDLLPEFQKTASSLRWK